MADSIGKPGQYIMEAVKRPVDQLYWMALGHNWLKLIINIF